MQSTAATEVAVWLGGLPEWDLADLYTGINVPELARDLEKASVDIVAFETRWKGTLAVDADSSLDKFGEAMQAYEALEELIGCATSYANLVYAVDASDPKRAKRYGDIQGKMTDVSASLRFFVLKLNFVDNELIMQVFDINPAFGNYRPSVLNFRNNKPYSLRIESNSCSTRSRSPVTAPETSCSMRR